MLKESPLDASCISEQSIDQPPISSDQEPITIPFVKNRKGKGRLREIGVVLRKSNVERITPRTPDSVSGERSNIQKLKDSAAEIVRPPEAK